MQVFLAVHMTKENKFLDSTAFVSKKRLLLVGYYTCRNSFLKNNYLKLQSGRLQFLFE